MVYHSRKNLNKSKEKIKRCKSPYGGGRASEKIVEILSEIKIDRKLSLKKMTY